MCLAGYLKEFMSNYVACNKIAERGLIFIKLL